MRHTGEGAVGQMAVIRVQRAGRKMKITPVLLSPLKLEWVATVRR